MLVARCQAGKTGAFQELIRLMLENGDVMQVYILCGSNDTDLRAQAHTDTKKANPAAYASGDVIVLFRQDFKGAHLNLENALVVIDETHMDQTQDQEMDVFLRDHGLSLDGNPKTLEEKNAFLVSVDATPYSELSAFLHKESYPKHVEILAPGKDYIGLQEFFYKGLINSTYDISRHRRRFTEMVLSRGNHKYGLMRLSSGKHAREQEAAAISVYKEIGGKVFHYTAEKEEIAIASLVDAPKVPTLVIICGRLRAGKVVPKQHVAFVWEGAKKSKTDAIIQGLVGRMCGYPLSQENPYGYGDTMPLIFVPESALKRHDGKVIKASEIERAIMEYPLSLPTMGTNLKKGRIANVASNGKTQCPPLRLTWGGEWSPPTNEEGKHCHNFLLAQQWILDDAPFSAEQKTEIRGFLGSATPRTRTLQRDASSSFKKYFGAIIESHRTKTACAEHVTDCPEMTFFITKDAVVKGSDRTHLYVVFYTTATKGIVPGIMAVDLKSRIPQTNGKSIFSIHAHQVDQPLVAGGLVGLDESKIKTPALLESALRVYLDLYRESGLTVARCIQSNKDRFSLSKEAFNYVSSKENDVEAIRVRLSSQFGVKMKVFYARSGASTFNIKKIEW